MLGLVPQSIMNWITLLLTTLMCRLRTGTANEDEAFVLLPEYDEDDSRFKRASLVMCHPEQTFFCVNATHYIPCTHVDLTDADSEQTLASASQVFHCGPRRCCEVGGDSPCTYRCEHLQPSLDYDHPNLKWTFPKIQPKARRKRKRKEFPEDMSEYVPPVKKISIKTFVFEYEDLSEEDAKEISSDGWKPSYRKNCPGMKLIAATSIPSTAAYLSSTFSTFTSPTVYDDLSVTFNISVFTTEHQNISIDTVTDLVSSTSAMINITMTEEFTQESSARSSMETLSNDSSLTTAPPIPTTTKTTYHTQSSSTTANTPNSTAILSATPSNISKTAQQTISSSIIITSTTTPKKILKPSKRKTAKPTLETFTVKKDLITLPFNYKGICPGIGDFPYFINCYRYIRCYLYLNKVKVEHKRCPSNKEFDSVLKLCVRAGQSDCIMGPSGRLKVAMSTERSSRTPLTHTPPPKHITSSTTVPTTILNIMSSTKSTTTLNTAHTTNKTMTPTTSSNTTPTTTTTMTPTTTSITTTNTTPTTTTAMTSTTTLATTPTTTKTLTQGMTSTTTPTRTLTPTPTTTRTLTQTMSPTTTPDTVPNTTLTMTPTLASTVNPTTTLTTTLATTPTITRIWTIYTMPNQTRAMTSTSTPTTTQTLTPTTAPTPTTTMTPSTTMTMIPTLTPTTIPATTPATLPATTSTSSPTKTIIAMSIPLPTNTPTLTPTTTSNTTPITRPATTLTATTTPTTSPTTTPTSSPATTLTMILTSMSTTTTIATPITTPTTAFTMTPTPTPTTIPATTPTTTSTPPTTPNTTPAFSTSTQKLNTGKKTHQNKDEEESSEDYEEEHRVLCPGVGNYPYPLSCTRYVKCTKRNGIIKYEHRRCPLSKEFDQKKRKCVPAGKSGCKTTILGVKPLDDLE